MIRGLDVFKTYFEGYENQYVLIGGAACDVLFASNEGQFRATRDLDVVLIVEALTPDFIEKFYQFVQAGNYRNKVTGKDKPQFYRFDKPENSDFPKMIELFAGKSFELKSNTGITPVYTDSSVSSLSAILLDDDYYNLLLRGRENIHGLSVLRPEYLIIFKAKAFLDLMHRRENLEKVDSRDIKKHKNDILKITAEFNLTEVEALPDSIRKDMKVFIEHLEDEPFELNVLKAYGLQNGEPINKLREIYRIHI